MCTSPTEPLPRRGPSTYDISRVLAKEELYLNTQNTSHMATPYIYSCKHYFAELRRPGTAVSTEHTPLRIGVQCARHPAIHPQKSPPQASLKQAPGRKVRPRRAEQPPPAGASSSDPSPPPPASTPGPPKTLGWEQGGTTVRTSLWYVSHLLFRWHKRRDLTREVTAARLLGAWPWPSRNFPNRSGSDPSMATIGWCATTLR